MVASLALVLALGNADLDEARALCKSLHYSEALPRLKKATESRGLSSSERREAFDLLARAWAAEGDMVAAQAAYGDLLARDAMAPPPVDAAPKLREAYRAAKAGLYPPGTVRLTLRSPTSVELLDPWGAVERIDVHVGGKTHQLKPAPVIEIKVGATVEAHGSNGSMLATLSAPSDAPARPRRQRGDSRSDEKDTTVAQNDPPATAPPPDVGAPPPAPPIVVVEEAKPVARRWPAIIGFGIGAVLAGVGAAVAGSFARTDEGNVTSLRFSQKETYDVIIPRQHAEAVTADVFLGLAIVCFGAFVISLFMGPPSQE
jgi:hypothetical protein